VHATEGAERGADETPDGIGGEHPTHAHVLLAWPALQRVEGHADPESAGTEPHQRPRREVHAERVAHHEAEGAYGDKHQRDHQQRPRSAPTDRPPGECEADHHAGGERRDEQPDCCWTRTAALRDGRRDGDDDAVARGVERAECE
jgi:hypothetical protein